MSNATVEPLSPEEIIVSIHDKAIFDRINVKLDYHRRWHITTKTVIANNCIVIFEYRNER